MLSIETNDVKKGRVVRNFKQLKNITKTDGEMLASTDLPCVVYRNEKDLVADLFPKPTWRPTLRVITKDPRLEEEIKNAYDPDFRHPSFYAYGPELVYDGGQIRVKTSEIRSLGVEKSLEMILKEMNLLRQKSYKDSLKSYKKDVEKNKRAIAAFKKKNWRKLLTFRKKGFIILELEPHSCPSWGSPTGIH